MYARSDRYDVKVFEEETRLNATLVVDYSGSMGYGSTGQSKLDYARMLAASLAFLMVRQGDAVGLVTCDTGVRQQFPVGATMGHLVSLLAELEEQPVGGETSLGTILESLPGRLNRRSLVILISDCLDHAQPLSRALQALRFAGHDVRIFQVLDPAEQHFAFDGSFEFIGMEGEAPLRLDASRIRKLYQETLNAHREELSAGCHRAGVAFTAASTDEDLAMLLVRALTQGGQAPQGQRK